MSENTLPATININGVDLPNNKANRAAWALHVCRTAPLDAHVDDEGLVWARHGACWYSVAGNYSRYSPAEKIILNSRFDAEQALILRSAEAIYEEVMYQSRIREAVLERDNRTCQVCGCVGPTKLHVHHIMKLRAGGTDHLDNLVTVCPKCHARADRNLYDPEWTSPRDSGGGRISYGDPEHYTVFE